MIDHNRPAPSSDSPSSRRSFLAAAGAAATAAWRGRKEILSRSSTPISIFTTRPALRAHPIHGPRMHLRSYRATFARRQRLLGIVGGIKVEASPWVEDNLWVLMIIEKEPMIVGMIGNLDPVKPEFREYLERYHRNKLFLGIRYGNVWEGHDLVTAVDRPDFIANMKAFAQTGLTLEVANPRLDLIDATVRLTDKVPELRVVLGHLQALALPTAPDVLKSYSDNLKELRKRNVYAKVSGYPVLGLTPSRSLIRLSTNRCWTSSGTSSGKT